MKVDDQTEVDPKELNSLTVSMGLSMIIRRISIFRLLSGSDEPFLTYSGWNLSTTSGGLSTIISLHINPGTWWYQQAATTNHF